MLFGIATILTVVSGINYVLKNKHVFKDDEVVSKTNETEIKNTCCEQLEVANFEKEEQDTKAEENTNCACKENTND